MKGGENMYLEFKNNSKGNNSDITTNRLCYGCEVICFLACTGCDGCQNTCGSIMLND